MSVGFSKIGIKNYRSLANLSLDLKPINILFGPNGSGKSTLLDTIWFFRDCAIRGVELASSVRNHGIGLLWDQAEENAQIVLNLFTERIEYELRFGFSSGRIEAFAGESLISIREDSDSEVRISRAVGSDKANLYNERIQSAATVKLREPEKLSLGLYLDFNPTDEDGSDFDRVLRFVRQYHSRSLQLYRLKQHGSEMSHETRLWDRGDNCFSVLRNLHDRRSFDNRYDTIMELMSECFPSFDGILFEQTGPETIYASFREKGKRKEIRASGVSDGHLQMLLLLTALFSEGPSRSSVLLFDEPELSLHPWALAVFAKAVKLASDEWEKQVLIATHSPVLLSQFELDEIISTHVTNGSTILRRLSDIDDIKDLLEEYAAGSLYMSEMIGAQSKQSVEANGVGIQ